MVSSYQRSSGSSGGGGANPAPPPASARAAQQPPGGVSNRLCAQCRNHGLRVPVRGHKRYCAYRLCTCRECRLVRERQRVVALHLYVRRAQEQEEEAAAAQEASSSSSPAPRPQDAPPTPEPAPRAADPASADTRERLLYESLQDLQRAFPVSAAGLPLLLCILKSSRSVPEASAKIVQGAHDLSARGFLGLDAFPRPPPHPYL